MLPIWSKEKIVLKDRVQLFKFLELRSVVDPKSVTRSSAVVWLVSLLRFLGKEKQLQSFLPRIQEALSALLGDDDYVTQV